jgi:signal transduction histidine kinase
MIAHDLRSPAAAIQMGLADLSRKFGDDPEAAWRFPMMDAQVTRALSVAEEVADLVAIHAGQLRLQRIALELRAFVQRLVREASAQRGRKVVFARGTPVWVYGDETRLARVVSALIAVARLRAKAAVTLSLRVEADWALLQIVDDGSSAAPEELAALLEGRFSESPPPRGFGLRLAATGAVIAGHGGTLNVSVTEGGGIRTTLRLPEMPELAQMR